MWDVGGKGNGCFHYKEFEHNKRYCSKLDRRPNATLAEEARDHGQMGENFEEKRERRAFQEQGALGLILELEKREILKLEAVSVELEKLPRTKPNTHRALIASHTCHASTDFELCNSCNDDFLDITVDPHDVELYCTNLLTWEGETLGNTGGFSPERELSRLGEKWHFGTVDTVRFSLEREGQI
ncbi:hypothetical protein Lal_00027104 [Lupinus albus]|nr:hypothetical protein Lal_00027104 [Lupinus albus]